MHSRMSGKKHLLMVRNDFINNLFSDWHNVAGLDPKKTPRLMTSNSPVNFWFRCVDMQVRGYFFIESLRKPPTANFNGFESCFIEFL